MDINKNANYYYKILKIPKKSTSNETYSVIYFLFAIIIIISIYSIQILGIITVYKHIFSCIVMCYFGIIIDDVGNGFREEKTKLIAVLFN